MNTLEQFKIDLQKVYEKHLRSLADDLDEVYAKYEDIAFDITDDLPSIQNYMEELEDLIESIDNCPPPDEVEMNTVEGAGSGVTLPAIDSIPAIDSTIIVDSVNDFRRCFNLTHNAARLQRACEQLGRSVNNSLNRDSTFYFNRSQ